MVVTAKDELNHLRPGYVVSSRRMLVRLRFVGGLLLAFTRHRHGTGTAAATQGHLSQCVVISPVALLIVLKPTVSECAILKSSADSCITQIDTDRRRCLQSIEREA